MPRERYRYDVYERNCRILEMVTAEEIRDYFGRSKMKMADYKGNRKYQGKYTILKSEMQDSQVPKRKNPYRCYMPDEWKRDWEQSCRVYRGYIWVKETEKGVKRLCKKTEKNLI